MALEAERAQRPYPAVSARDISAWAALVVLATDKNRPVDPRVWGDEKRMKRELWPGGQDRGRSPWCGRRESSMRHRGYVCC
ncbi:hypothetical protein EJB05_57609, partial [Eragrostis curvula]